MIDWLAMAVDADNIHTVEFPPSVEQRQAARALAMDMGYASLLALETAAAPGEPLEPPAVV